MHEGAPEQRNHYFQELTRSLRQGGLAAGEEADGLLPKDFINLTFCCQKATVITDFSDLEQVGRDHYMNLHGGCARTEELENLDGVETAHLLISDNEGTITPFGVVYDNGMELEQTYNGHQFPAYLYDSHLMVLEITPKNGLRGGQNPEYL